MQFCATVRRATREPAPDSAKLVPSFRRVGIEEGLDDGEIVFLSRTRIPTLPHYEWGAEGRSWPRLAALRAEVAGSLTLMYLGWAKANGASGTAAAEMLRSR